MKAKKVAAEKAAEFVEQGMTIGLGTGSTAYYFIYRLAEMVRDGLRVKAVPTSLATEALARQLGIPIINVTSSTHIDLAVDGADEIDPQKNLIKGGGGALFREKIVAYNSSHFMVIGDRTKLVDKLGRFPVPIEVLPFASEFVLRDILTLCETANIRTKDGSTYITDNGNYIIDCHCNVINDAASFHEELKRIPGIIESGIFLSAHVGTVILGSDSGETEIF